jgi:hypothetical protein
MLGVFYEIALISYPFILTTRRSENRLSLFRAIFFALLCMPTIGLAILRIVSLDLSLQQPSDPAQHASTALVMQIQMTYNVIAASLICLAFNPTAPAEGGGGAAGEASLLPTTNQQNTPSTPLPPPSDPTTPADSTADPPSFDRSPRHHPRSYFRFLRKKSTPDRPSAMHALQMSLSCDSAWTVTRAERGRGFGVEYSLLNGRTSLGGTKMAAGGKDDIVVVSTVEVKFEESPEGIGKERGK